MLTIDLRDLNLFLTEFFPASGEVKQAPVPLHIVVWICPHDIAKAQKFDLRPIFLSRAKNKGQQWFFISLGSPLLSCEDMESYCEDFGFFGGLVAQVATVRVRDERGKHLE